MIRYYNVRLGRLNRLNGPSTVPFPSRKAAVKFATNHSQMAPERVIIVRDPDGRIIKRFGRKQNLKRKART
ncbi:hypothetical protein SEA_KABOCHA_84 [Gordonia phage Kabocha]|uniref:Uncharacterized protein n=1 Tax=Gordonia phage Chidiebere TaxID=2656530 RepID=A0A649VMQ4_9CAUD|nr:hypothetical protein PQD14_gp083 [Gordonia phage Chidiebere]AZS07936.1 hypothetical protein PBI_GRAY_83 [Gordonia phage Gray]WAA19870.1 hypothetical protein SEA_KABOCHA_84 [Gordonia phage Kabocha]WAA20059.1 hypothetical protein SEA_HANEM_82 [Gordonia phage Hanem]WNM67102.1 hypothetical protein SEA_SCHOMBER_81 [Gordonia Phage Schomber]QGJ92973.1 hypothetical protein PBI_CHIDIEBERE_83 [Gordonia phage Chidiebere]